MKPSTKPSPKKVFELLVGSATPLDAPTLLQDRIAEELLGSGHAEDVDSANELAEALVARVRVLVIDAHAQASASGQAWVIEVFGTEDEYIRGSSSYDASLSPDEQRIRSNRHHTASILTAIRALSPRDFEHACRAVLQFMGCADPQTSRSGNDGGIDFYGRLELKGRLDSKSPYGGIDSRVGIWLVGQAKHYPTRVIQTAHIRELVGSVELARTGGAIHIWPHLELRPFDATLQLLFTTGKFSGGSRRLLEKTGIIAMDGEQLATFLADAGVGISPDGSTFDPTLFRSALVVSK